MGQFDNKQWAGSSEEVVASCDGVYYANKSDVVLAFGRINVDKWADLNNNEDEDEMDTRICWALRNSNAYINDRLAGGPYDIPFATPYPDMITMCCAKLAGVYLYDSRGVTDIQKDGKEVNQVSFFRKEVEKYLMGLLSNRFNLAGVDRAINYPKAIKTITQDRKHTRFLGSESCPNS